MDCLIEVNYYSLCNGSIHEVTNTNPKVNLHCAVRTPRPVPRYSGKQCVKININLFGHILCVFFPWYSLLFIFWWKIIIVPAANRTTKDEHNGWGHRILQYTNDHKYIHYILHNKFSRNGTWPAKWYESLKMTCIMSFVMEQWQSTAFFRRPETETKYPHVQRHYFRSVCCALGCVLLRAFMLYVHNYYYYYFVRFSLFWIISLTATSNCVPLLYVPHSIETTSTIKNSME